MYQNNSNASSLKIYSSFEGNEIYTSGNKLSGLTLNTRYNGIRTSIFRRQNFIAEVVTTYEFKKSANSTQIENRRTILFCTLNKSSMKNFYQVRKGTLQVDSIPLQLFFCSKLFSLVYSAQPTLRTVTHFSTFFGTLIHSPRINQCATQ